MQDLLYNFKSPSIMDCKIGQRTFSESEVIGDSSENIRKTFGESTRKDFQHTHTWNEIINHFKLFIQHRKIIAQNYLIRLLKLRTILEVSDFFAKHEFIGSSLLFVHDQSGYANIWLIDFAKIASPSNNQIRVNHRSVWKPGNYEDGYLIGIDNLVKLFEEIIHECQ
ncbi:1D-myo-inositol-triphosphate 3-kinase [Schistosoma bovis]|uniref:Kinase n=1 Tax=Schistosoma bovis TaxID=6184 RepID=A0A430Q9D6_SCHBO|nr:1D-myo-inositol-triphosphate 3-kinase [Schistosoma bovis]